MIDNTEELLKAYRDGFRDGFEEGRKAASSHWRYTPFQVWC